MSLVDSIVGLEAMSRYLTANGWKNDLSDGVIRVSQRQVSRITMRVGGHIWFPGGGARLRVGPIPVYASQGFPVQVIYAFEIDPARDPEAFAATLKWERDGLLGFGEICRARFVGGGRCERLNDAPSRVLALARCMRRFERLRVAPDVAAGQVKVIHQQKMRVRFSLLGSELVDVERFLPPRELFESLEWLGRSLEKTRRGQGAPASGGSKANRSRGTGTSTRGS